MHTTYASSSSMCFIIYSIEYKYTVHTPCCRSQNSAKSLDISGLVADIQNSPLECNHQP